METAVSWESAAPDSSGLPAPIASIFQSSELGKSQLLFAVAEHKVQLEGKGGAAQCDVWALVQTSRGMASLSVEAKAKEPFGKNHESLSDWFRAAPSADSLENRRTRWQHIEANLPARAAGAFDLVPYQILQRCAAAVIEANRFRVKHAVFLVQSFSAPAESFERYKLFTSALDLPAERGRLVFSRVGDIQLGIGWVDCPFADDRQMVRALSGQTSD